MLLNDFYTIQHSETLENGISVMVKINKAHEIFKGHFPNHPVTPGVCTMQIIKELSEKHLGKNLMLKTARNVKFMAIINPEENEDVRFDLSFETNESDEISIKATVSIEGNSALKFGGNFKKI
ncbi:3-hydroxyacyl-ACP dehydratase [Moheibacter sp. BDHS18]|uniref:3-hydroxyacyl-ACP dehydratase n=2 Tax=Moheibacter lacus TaxID=2745851 RepID=A0A838ZHQ9_9FLAO|nr:3-hydroxyacyl-ACP dehydratase [Moheibacter lacus]